MKFVLFVEGKTEKTALPEFIKRRLDKQLIPPVGVKMVRFEGWRNYVEGIATKVGLTLRGDPGADVIACIGLLDLYGPEFYPDNVALPRERYAWAKRHIEQKVAHPKFRQHFAVHETEAWLLSDLSIFPHKVRSALPAKPPETVNFNEPPAKLLERVYPLHLDRPYRKVLDGKNLFLDLSPDVVYERCPHFKILLDDMIHLANAIPRGAI